MVLDIVCVTHATSLDNEAGVASGQTDPGLSRLGMRQAAELSARFAGERFDLVVCSDLRRSWQTATIGFRGRLDIVREGRLREVDYGTLARHPTAAIDAVRLDHVEIPFPQGESWHAAVTRHGDLLADLAAGQSRVLVIGHRATYVALQHLCAGIPLAEAVADPRPWQPRWDYAFDGGAAPWRAAGGCRGNDALSQRSVACGVRRRMKRRFGRAESAIAFSM